MFSHPHHHYIHAHHPQCQILYDYTNLNTLCRKMWNCVSFFFSYSKVFLYPSIDIVLFVGRICFSPEKLNIFTILLQSGKCRCLFRVITCYEVPSWHSDLWAWKINTSVSHHAISIRIWKKWIISLLDNAPQLPT